MRRTRWLTTALAVTLPILPLHAALAQPCEKRTLVVGYSPGGTGDIVAGAVADALARKLNQPVSIEHRPGASGGAAAEAVSKGAGDGCMLLVGQTAEIAVNPTVVRDLGYQPSRDLKPVAMIATAPLALVVSRTAPYSNVSELVVAARAATPALTFASAGRATPGYFAGELLRLRTRTGMTHIAYQGGGEALDAVVRGSASVYFPALPTAVQEGTRDQLKILAVSSTQRSFTMPDVPTLEEAGLAPFNLDLWIGLFASRSTPDPVILELNKAVNEVLLHPDVRSALLVKGATGTPMTVEQFRSFVASETSRYETLIQSEFCASCPW